MTVTNSSTHKKSKGKLIMPKFQKFCLTGGTQIAIAAAVVASLAGASLAKDVTKYPVKYPLKNHPFETLYTFSGGTGSSGLPFAGVITDKVGNLYGAAAGQSNLKGACDTFGTIFKLTASGALQALHAFNGNDGDYPVGGIVRDKKGNIYGTTETNVVGGQLKWGEVFKIAPDGAFNILHTFSGRADGGDPKGALIRDNAGNLYGTTVRGGGGHCNQHQGCGTVFKVSQSGELTVLHVFGGDDGASPSSTLLLDSGGNLYGTTSDGGANHAGVVFKLGPVGTETVLYSFDRDEGGPIGGVIADGAGNLYGTTPAGGTYGYGTVFKIAADGTESVLYSFTGAGDGALPEGAPIMDRKGNLYGTTNQGGVGTGNEGFGVVYQLSPSGVEKTLYAFQGGADGSSPTFGSLTLHKGYLYGTATYGGEENCQVAGGFGVVFRVKK